MEAVASTGDLEKLCTCNKAWCPGSGLGGRSICGTAGDSGSPKFRSARRHDLEIDTMRVSLSGMIRPTAGSSPVK